VQFLPRSPCLPPPPPPTPFALTTTQGQSLLPTCVLQESPAYLCMCVSPSPCRTHHGHHPRIFVESNIDDLLARGSRVVQIQDAEADGETISKFSFSKTQFHSSNADASLDMSDPDFWAKVLGQDTRETLVTRLKDGTATANDRSKAEFLKEVFELAQEVGAVMLLSLPVWFRCRLCVLRPIHCADAASSVPGVAVVIADVCVRVCPMLGQVVDLKLRGNPHPKYCEEAVSALIEISAMKRTFRWVMLVWGPPRNVWVCLPRPRTQLPHPSILGCWWPSPF
jgi:hypothetical protein